MFLIWTEVNILFDLSKQTKSKNTQKRDKSICNKNIISLIY